MPSDPEEIIAGKLSGYDEYDETRADFSRWKGIYETWRRRKQAYTEQLSIALLKFFVCRHPIAGLF